MATRPSGNTPWHFKSFFRQPGLAQAIDKIDGVAVSVKSHLIVLTMKVQNADLDVFVQGVNQQ